MAVYVGGWRRVRCSTEPEARSVVAELRAVLRSAAKQSAVKLASRKKRKANGK